MRGLVIGIMAFGLTACSTTVSDCPAEPSSPIVIAHRGASGTLPEHTLEAYLLAIDEGADFIEPDLVLTKDGVLVARHDPWLSDSTDIADHPEFADRKTTVTDPNGREITDWFAWDFTLEEIKILRATQTRASRDQSYNGQYEIPTFEEILNLTEAGYTISVPMPGFDADVSTFIKPGVCLYVETKWPSAHKARGLDMAEALLRDLNQRRLLNPELENRGDCAPFIYVQSFEKDILVDLDERSDLPLVQLVFPAGYAPDGSPSYALEDIATYADGVGPFKSLVIDLMTGESTGYAERAVEMGLAIHPWTFRDDDIAPGFNTPEEEIGAILNAGATGFFTDFPATGVSARDAWLGQNPSRDARELVAE